MGKMTSLPFYCGAAHNDLFFGGHYHTEAYIGGTLVWKKLSGGWKVLAQNSKPNSNYRPWRTGDGRVLISTMANQHFFALTTYDGEYITEEDNCQDHYKISQFFITHKDITPAIIGEETYTLDYGENGLSLIAIPGMPTMQNNFYVIKPFLPRVGMFGRMQFETDGSKGLFKIESRFIPSGYYPPNGWSAFSLYGEYLLSDKTKSVTFIADKEYDFGVLGFTANNGTMYNGEDTLFELSELYSTAPNEGAYDGNYNVASIFVPGKIKIIQFYLSDNYRYDEDEKMRHFRFVYDTESSNFSKSEYPFNSYKQTTEYPDEERSTKVEETRHTGCGFHEYKALIRSYVDTFYTKPDGTKVTLTSHQVVEGYVTKEINLYGVPYDYEEKHVGLYAFNQDEPYWQNVKHHEPGVLAGWKPLHSSPLVGASAWNEKDEILYVIFRLKKSDGTIASALFWINHFWDLSEIEATNCLEIYTDTYHYIDEAEDVCVVNNVVFYKQYGAPDGCGWMVHKGSKPGNFVPTAMCSPPSFYKNGLYYYPTAKDTYHSIDCLKTLEGVYDTGYYGNYRDDFVYDEKKNVILHCANSWYYDVITGSMPVKTTLYYREVE